MVNNFKTEDGGQEQGPGINLSGFHPLLVYVTVNYPCNHMCFSFLTFKTGIIAETISRVVKIS